MTRRRCAPVAFGLTVALCIMTVCATPASAVRRMSPPQDYGPLPEFALTDETEQSVTRQALSGQVWIADFIFTRCAGQCPMMSSQMAKLQERFHDVSDLRLVSFTVDPAHDTPEVLAAYARHYGAVSPRWRFLTGDRETLWALARDGFKLGVNEDGTAEEPITHSVRLVLVDRTGHIRGYYDATDAQALERLFHEAHRVLEEGREDSYAE